MTALCALVLVGGSSGPPGQPACRPPTDLLVCQDSYGPRGRVFLVWTNGETSYTSVRIFMDGDLVDEKPGDAEETSIGDISPRSHVFSVEGACGSASSPRTEKSFEVVTVTPHERPFETMTCSHDSAERVITVSLTPSSTPSLFIDVFRRRAGVFGLQFVGTVAGNVTRVFIGDSEESDRIFLQFFDMACYGSELAGCPGETCLPPLDVRVCQDTYGEESRVFLLWLPNASGYTGFEIFLDGTRVGFAGANRGLFFIDPVSPGMHSFGVKGICGTLETDVVMKDFEVLRSSPHTEPAQNLKCRFDEAEETISVTWGQGKAPSIFIDVFLRRPGQSDLDHVGTAAGHRTSVRVRHAHAGDEVVLQFFNEDCYGSPLITCTEGPGSGFIRGDSNGSGNVDLGDAVFTLNFLFLGRAEPLCLDATDGNDDGMVDIADPVRILNWLFAGAPDPPAPGGLTCGMDPTDDVFPACLTSACP